MGIRFLFAPVHTIVSQLTLSKLSIQRYSKAGTWKRRYWLAQRWYLKTCGMRDGKYFVSRFVAFEACAALFQLYGLATQSSVTHDMRLLSVVVLVVSCYLISFTVVLALRKDSFRRETLVFAAALGDVTVIVVRYVHLARLAASSSSSSSLSSSSSSSAPAFALNSETAGGTGAALMCGNTVCPEVTITELVLLWQPGLFVIFNLSAILDNALNRHARKLLDPSRRKNMDLQGLKAQELQEIRRRSDSNWIEPPPDRASGGWQEDLGGFRDDDGNDDENEFSTDNMSFAANLRRRSNSLAMIFCGNCSFRRRGWWCLVSLPLGVVGLVIFVGAFVAIGLQSTFCDQAFPGLWPRAFPQVLFNHSELGQPFSIGASCRVDLVIQLDGGGGGDNLQALCDNPLAKCVNISGYGLTAFPPMLVQDRYLWLRRYDLTGNGLTAVPTKTLEALRDVKKAALTRPGLI
eukprot:g4868.t1